MFERLNPRERIFVSVGGVAVLLCLLYFVILMPYRNAMTRLDKQIITRSQQLREVRALQSEYMDLQKQMSLLEKRLAERKGFSVLTFVENLVGQTAGREKILSMRPQSSVARGVFTVDAVELRLEKLSLKQVLQFLWEVETESVPMQVKSFYLKQRFDNPALLDATMTVTALRRTL